MSKKFTRHIFTIVIIFFTSIIVCFSSNLYAKPKEKDLTSEERIWMTKFFKEILLEEGGIYTLWGSKPMTRITLYYYTQDEINAYYNALSEEEKSQTVTVDDYDLPENWKKWEAIQNRFDIQKYYLFKRESAENPKVAEVYFINILQTALVIQNHYEQYKKIVGFDFDPFNVVLEIQNQESEFWKKSLNNSALLGILFGYGSENSWCFHWKYKNHPEKIQTIADTIKSKFSDHQYHHKTSISHFPLPIFASFSEDGKDVVIEKYKKEREEIKKAYRGRDFLEVTLRKLTSN